MSNSKNRESRLHGQLLSLQASDLAPPHVDPRVAALVALGVVDFANSAEGRPRFAELQKLGAFDPELLEDLAQLAQALMRVLDTYDTAPRDAKPVFIAHDLDVECRTRRTALVALLEKQAPYAPGVDAALRRVKLAYGPLDLAIDLRALAALVERNELDATLPGDTRALARRLEDALVSSDTPELREARRAMHRVWSVFEATYVKLAELGRELFSEDPEALFPTLDAIASIERTARDTSSSQMPASLLVERAMPPSVRASVSSRRMRAVRQPFVEAAKPVSASVELDHASDSNLWLGFSQDIAEGGLFFATYVAHALGVPMELVVHLGESEPMTITGVVHWTRPQVGNDDAPPGVGVRFTNLAPETVRALQTFARHRTPIFYDD